MAEIVITLPKDRSKPGSLRLYDDTHEVIFGCACFGRSAGHATNPSRDPLKFRGHTPTGSYEKTFVSRLAQPVTGIGDLWIGLDPSNFSDTQARKAELAGRTGLGIHGGRGNAVLKATHGCIRVSDRDMEALAKVAGKVRFTVSIVEKD